MLKSWIIKYESLIVRSTAIIAFAAVTAPIVGFTLLNMFVIPPALIMLFYLYNLLEINRQKMEKQIFFNGRFLTQGMTGVQRTAYELVLATDALIEKGIIDRKEFSFKLLYSGNILNEINLKHIEIVNKGFLKGNLWEQLELPFYTRNGLLISMCTVSPLLKRKQIVFIHDASIFTNPKFFSFIFRTWYKIAIAALRENAEHIVTVSEFSKNELITYASFNAEKVSVIPNAAEHILRYGVPTESFKQKVADLKPYFLAVSSLSANKNFEGLSKALNKIDFNGYNMLIAGGSVHTLQSTKPDSRINYLGYVSNEELKHLYKNASIFIFPSFYEGFGIPPLEAMTCGCPCIVSNTSSLPEIFADTCEYFDPFDIDDMAIKIGGLIKSQRQQVNLKYRGFEQSKKYNWEKSANKLFALIEKLFS
jgi:glycosyltransferase involved in cell wall biosynthesis